MTVTRDTANASSSFWTRERAVAVGILQALIAVGAGCASVVAGHPAGAPIADGVGVVAFLASYLIRQGVFSEATVAEIGKGASVAATVGEVLSAHAEDVATIVNSLAGDIRAPGAGNLAPIGTDAVKVREIVNDPVLIELARLGIRAAAGEFAAPAEWTPAAPAVGPAYPTPPPAAPAA